MAEGKGVPAAKYKIWDCPPSLSGRVITEDSQRGKGEKMVEWGRNKGLRILVVFVLRVYELFSF